MNTNNALSATRASSFAAALRKLAKQAGDPPGKYRTHFAVMDQERGIAALPHTFKEYRTEF